MAYLYLSFILLYLLISNLAVVAKLYKSSLKYMSPVKGYIASFFIVVSLLTIDYFVFDFASKKINSMDRLSHTAQNTKLLPASVR